jgi:hypothetical protein
MILDALECVCKDERAVKYTSGGAVVRLMMLVVSRETKEERASLRIRFYVIT